MTPESVTVARRFVLGRQGLWPGRRWRGRSGLLPAVRYIGSIQYDPLDVVGRNQDLSLWGRIVGYRTTDLEDALYRTRSLFESGGNVQIRPIEELPYLRVPMERKVAEKRWRPYAGRKRSLVARVVREIEARGPLGARDFRRPGEPRIANYRARTESALAVYYLWLRGDVMIAFRRQGEKVFDLTSRLFPRPFPIVSVAEAEEHLLLGTLRDLGLASGSEWRARAHGRIGRSTLRSEWTERLRRWEAAGAIEEIEVEGWKGRRWILTESVGDLEAVRSGGVPRAWRPRATTTEEEVVFLAPGEAVSAHGRSVRLFDFAYLWEVYKPAAERRWGYYTLPVLWGDRLRARIEFKFDRPAGALRVVGFWPEEPLLRTDADFGAALGRAMGRLADFLRATSVDVAGLRSPKIERTVRRTAMAARADPGR